MASRQLRRDKQAKDLIGSRGMHYVVLWGNLLWHSKAPSMTCYDRLHY